MKSKQRRTAKCTFFCTLQVQVRADVESWEWVPAGAGSWSSALAEQEEPALGWAARGSLRQSGMSLTMAVPLHPTGKEVLWESPENANPQVSPRERLRVSQPSAGPWGLGTGLCQAVQRDASLRGRCKLLPAPAGFG